MKIGLPGKLVYGGVLLAALLAASFAQAEYVAYANVGKEKIPLPEDIDSIESKHLLSVTWGKGRPVRVGVLKVNNKSNAQSVTVVNSSGQYYYNSRISSGGIPVQGIEAIVTTVMHNSGRFRVIERSALKSVLNEQDLGRSGRISKPSAAKTGKVLGVKYLVKVEVTHYEPNYKGKSVGLGGLLRKVPLLGGVSSKSSKSMVGMNFRLINATTGEVAFTKQVKSIITESGLSFNLAGFGRHGALGGFMSSYSKTPVGQAVIAAVNKGVYALVKQMGDQPLRGVVSKVRGSNVYLNLGKGYVKEGDRLKVMSKGEKVTDPETGEVLGSEDEEVGYVVISKVKKRYSVAEMERGLRGKIKRKDYVIAAGKASKLLYAARWEGPQNQNAPDSGADAGNTESPSSDPDEDE